MAGAFGWTIEQVEAHVVGLIQAGEVQARVDSQNKVRPDRLRSSVILISPSDLASKANRLQGRIIC